MLARLNMTERAFKNILNLSFLTLSSILIVYFLVQLTSNLVIKIGIAIFAVILEVFMQYLLSTGRNRWRIKRRLQASLLFFFYGLYVLAYAVPSATGFFMAEINAQEQTSARVEMVEDLDKERLQQISSMIQTLNAQLLTESKSGYGQRSQLIMDEIKRLSEEQIAIQNSFKTPPPTQTVVAKDLFKVMGSVFQIPGNVLKMIIFSISVLMVYVGLIMTNWDLSFSKNNPVFMPDKEIVLEREIARTPDISGTKPADEASATLSESPPVPEMSRHETPRETPEIAKAGKAICSTCGKHFPHKKDKSFCCSDCRLKAYRQPVKEMIKDAQRYGSGAM